MINHEKLLKFLKNNLCKDKAILSILPDYEEIVILEEKKYNTLIRILKKELEIFLREKINHKLTIYQGILIIPYKLNYLDKYGKIVYYRDTTLYITKNRA